MRILLISLLALKLVHSSCPPEFELVRNGECRGNYTRITTEHDDTINMAITKCNEIQGHPIAIHSVEDQSYWTNRLFSSGLDWTVIGLVCNSSTKGWEWSDGSHVDFKPLGNYDSILEQDCENDLSWFINRNGHWDCVHFSGNITKDLYCITQLQQPIPSADGCDLFEDDNEDGVCYQVAWTSANWKDAQTTCRNFGGDLASIHSLKENSFVRRLAVSKGAVDGVFLGATISGKGETYGWIDGSEWDYDYFYPSFPMDGQGDCVAMDTMAPSGEWLNKNCSSKLPFACVRQQNNARPVCKTDPWKEGQLVFSPGFPFDASTPCEFILTVDADKNVEVHIQVLEANSCCDRLILADDFIGGNIIANITGELSDTTYTTQSSNLMRVSWQPNGGVNVRGFMLTFRGV